MGTAPRGPNPFAIRSIRRAIFPEANAMSAFIIAVIIIGGIAGLSFACQLCLDRLRCYRTTIHCACGACCVHDTIIVDPIMEDRWNAALTENCPACRENARNREAEGRRPAVGGWRDENEVGSLDASHVGA
jgi:hypothetical protein